MTAKEKVIREKILVGLDLTYKKLVKSKKENNHDFVVSENGRIIKLKPVDVE